MAPDPLPPEGRHALRRLRVREPGAVQRWATRWVRLFLGTSLALQVLRAMLHHALGWREAPPTWYEPQPASYLIVVSALIVLEVTALVLALADIGRRPWRYVVIFATLLTVEAAVCNHYFGSARGVYTWAAFAWLTSLLEAWRSHSRGRFGTYD